MNKNKIVTMGLALTLAVGAVACTKKEKTPQEVPKTEQEQQNASVDDVYSKSYSKYYNDYLAGLNTYSMYDTAESVNKAYENKEYPGNEKYLNEVKLAYKDSRDKIQSFVNSLKNDAKTEDTELKKMNEEMIAEGEKLISDIDAKIKKLDELPKDAMTKGREDFIKAVNETTTLKDHTKNSFNEMIKNMNSRLGITNNNATNNKITK